MVNANLGVPAFWVRMSVEYPLELTVERRAFSIATAFLLLQFLLWVQKVLFDTFFSRFKNIRFPANTAN
jgi:hypothetical protein